MPNALVHATSPYLQQHRDNPVEWHEWTEAALARRESVGSHYRRDAAEEEKTGSEDRDAHGTSGCIRSGDGGI